MAETVYTYSIINDTLDGTALASCLYEEINADSILSTPGSLVVFTEGDQILIHMVDALDSSEESVLDDLVALHSENNCNSYVITQDTTAVTETDQVSDFLVDKILARQGLSSEVTEESLGNQILNLDININELIEDSAPDPNTDFLAIYDISEETHNKTTISDLLTAGLGPSEQFSGVDTVGNVDISTGWTDIPLNTEHKKTSGFTHTGSSAEITVNVTGTYVLAAYVSTENQNNIDDSGSRMRIVRDTGAGYVEVAGTRARMSNDSESDDSGAGTVVITIDVTSGDKFKLQAERRAGTSTIVTIGDGSGLAIFSAGAQGIQGIQGPTGSGSNITLEEDGVLVTNTPHDTIDFDNNFSVSDNADGSATVSLADGATEQFSAVETQGGQDISGGWVDIPLQTEHKKTSGFTHSASSAEVTVNSTGTYLIIGYVSTDMLIASGANSNAQARLVEDTGGGYTEVAGTLVHMSSDASGADEHNTGSFSIILDLNAGDKFKLQAQQSQGDGTMLLFAGGSGLTLTTIGSQGPVGPQGPAGSGTTLTLQEGGSSVTNTPHDTLDFDADDFDVADNGDGSATVTLASGGGSVFGSELQQVESNGLSTTTSTSFQQKLRLTTNSLPSGTYRIGWQFSVFCDATGDVTSRVELDDTTELDHHSIDNSTDDYNSNGGFSYHTFSGVHTIDIDYKATAGTAKIKYARIEIWRIL